MAVRQPLVGVKGFQWIYSSIKDGLLYRGILGPILKFTHSLYKSGDEGRIGRFIGQIVEVDTREDGVNS